MAFRTPLKLNGSDLQVMSATDLANIHQHAIHAYALNPSVTLSVVASDGNLNRMIDRRYAAGAASLSNTGFSSNSPDVTAVDTVWDTLDMTVATTANGWDDSNVNIAYPVFWNSSGEIQAMTREDFYDTFIDPAIAEWYAPVGTGNFAGGGQYAVYEGADGVNGFTLVSTLPVFKNSVSDASIRAGNLPENPLDQPNPEADWESYYLYVKDTTAFSINQRLPFKINAAGELEQYTNATFTNMLQYHMRHAITSRVGSQIRYQIETASGTQGRTSGTGMADTHYASFTRRTQQIGDNYYTQEVPAGSITTRETYYLKIVNAGSVDGTDTNETYTATVSAGNINEGENVTFTLNTNNVPNGTVVPYSISGIQANDLSSGSLSGNVTIQSNSASVLIQLAQDTSEESETATCTFSTTEGARSASCTITDVVLETVSLEGTSSNPKQNPFPPIPGSNGMELGWRFRTDGKVAFVDNRDGSFTDITSGYASWSNVVNPDGPWYVRCTSRTGDGTIQGGWTLNTWYRIDATGGSSRRFMIKDLRTPGTYGPGDTTYTFQISADQSTVAATGYYKLQWEGGA